MDAFVYPGIKIGERVQTYKIKGIKYKILR